jgi:hypothetical protein
MSICPKTAAATIIEPSADEATERQFKGAMLLETQITPPFVEV